MSRDMRKTLSMKWQITQPNLSAHQLEGSSGPPRARARVRARARARTRTRTCAYARRTLPGPGTPDG